jgi:Transposase, Mutator family
VTRQLSTLLRNLERKAPKHALADLRTDFHQIVYASSAEAARIAYEAVERKWEKRCPAVVKSLRKGGASRPGPAGSSSRCSSLARRRASSPFANASR